MWEKLEYYLGTLWDCLLMSNEIMHKERGKGVSTLIKFKCKRSKYKHNEYSVGLTEGASLMEGEAEGA